MPGIVTSAVAAVKLICKDREDSFAADTSAIMWDGMEAPYEEEDIAFIKPSNDWLKGLNLQSRPAVTPGSASGKTKRRMHSKAGAEPPWALGALGSFGDENRSMDANVDRMQAMELASKPRDRLAAFGEPSLSELASARFQRGPSMQQSPRRMESSFRSRALQPGSPRPVDFKDFRPPSFAVSEQRGHASPRAGNSFAVSERISGQASPRGGHASPCHSFTGNSFALNERALGQASPRPRRAPLQAVVRSPSPRNFDDAEPWAEVSYVPPQLQPRQMGRCPSDDLHAVRAPSFGTHHVAKIAARSPRTPAPSLFGIGADMVREKLTAVAMHNEPLAGRARPARVNGYRSGDETTEPGLVSPHPSAHLVALTDKFYEELCRPPQRKKPTRSRSENIFWKPPPEAKVICESERSPSFILNAKAEAPQATGPVREATDASDIVDYRGGSASTQVVMHAVCSTVGSSLLKTSPSMPHMAPSQGSFTYARHRDNIRSPR